MRRPREGGDPYAVWVMIWKSGRDLFDRLVAI